MPDEKRRWKELYEYYVSKGLTMFLLDSVVSLLIGFGISAAPVGLFVFSDFSRLATAKSFSDIFVPLSSHPTPFVVCVFIVSGIFVLFNVVQLFQFLGALPRYISLHRYFASSLGISDTELAVLEWHEVVESVQAHQGGEMKTMLAIAQEILKMDNFICALVSDPSVLTWRVPCRDQMDLIPMTRFFFYLFRLCLSGIVLDSSGGSLVSGVQELRAGNVVRQFTQRSRLIGIGLAILSPFVLAFEILYLVFHYLQAVRASPQSLSLRRWTPQAKWLIREYNELPHLLRARIAKSYEPANYYMDMFPSVVVQPLLKILAFFSGSLLTILFVVGLLTDSGYLLTIEVVHGKSLAWLISILASVYGICKVSIVADVRPFSAEECMEEIERCTHYDFRDSKQSAHSWEAFNKFASFFQPIIVQLLIELVSVVLNPFLFIVVIPMKAGSVVEFVRQHSIHVQDLGWICSFSVFDQEQARRSRPAEQKKKYLRSLRNFSRLNPQGGDAPLIDIEDEAEESVLTPLPTLPLVRMDFGPGDDPLAGTSEIIGHDGDPFFV
jgi:autophagy-related protein 9